MRSVIFIYLCYLIMLAEGNMLEIAPTIVGGDKVPPDFGLFHASLQNLTGHHVCGGVIIAHRHLTTAAHCVNGAKPDYIRVVAGTVNLYVAGLKYEVQSIHMHHDYNSSLKLNDIAVLKIKGHFDLQRIKMIRIDENALAEGDDVMLFGFGARKPHGESMTHMKMLKQEVFSQETCRYAMRYNRDVHDTNFCTFTKKGQGTCHGDSGGPLTKEGKLVGIVSWGIPCGIGFPGVHTRIAPYVQWIRTVIDETSPKYCR